MKDQVVCVRRITLKTENGDVSYRWFHPNEKVPDVFFEHYYEYGNSKTLEVVGNDVISGTVVSEVIVLDGNACVVVQFNGVDFHTYTAFHVDLLG